MRDESQPDQPGDALQDEELVTEQAAEERLKAAEARHEAAEMRHEAAETRHKAAETRHHVTDTLLESVKQAEEVARGEHGSLAVSYLFVELRATREAMERASADMRRVTSEMQEMLDVLRGLSRDGRPG